MTFKDFCKKYNKIRLKYNISLFIDLIELYDEYYKKKKKTLDKKIIFNELCDTYNYTNKERDNIISIVEEILYFNNK